MTDRSSTVTIMTVFAGYVQQRHDGKDARFALNAVRALAELISKEQRIELGGLIKDWEAREGVTLRPAAAAPTYQHAATRPVIKRMPTPPNSAPVSTGGTACPHCGSATRRGDLYCPTCGQMLSVAKTATRALDMDEPGAAAAESAAFVSKDARIFLYIQDTAEPLELPPHAEIIIGRASADSPLSPDVDLTRYNGETMGVSRLHATLKRHETTITITDMGTLNHTFINGELLHPDEVRVLHDGDELRFGRLAATVRFRVLRRIQG